MRNLFGKKRIYLDFAAATPVDPRVLKKMQPYWSNRFGNPGGLHEEGRVTKDAVIASREHIAVAIGAHAEEIIFTASGTEGNNLALLGSLHALKEAGGLTGAHIIMSSAEHPSVRDCAEFFKEEGVVIDFVDFNEDGLVDPHSVAKLLRKETKLVSIGYVNNEVGTVQPIRKIAEVIRVHEKKVGGAVTFHTDASQAPLYFNCRISQLDVDLMTIDGQKIYGPKGVGFLYKGQMTPLSPIMKGGNQEFGLRPGTENVPLIVGLAEAFVLATAEREAECERIGALQNYFINKLEREIPRAVLNGDRKQRSPNNVNVSIPGIDNEYLAVALDEHGVAVATKSACIGYGDGKYSYVVASLTKDADRARSAIRFSLGRGVRKGDIDYVIAVIKREVAKIDRLKL